MAGAAIDVMSEGGAVGKALCFSMFFIAESCLERPAGGGLKLKPIFYTFRGGTAQKPA
jgi:hypothetical protein